MRRIGLLSADGTQECLVFNFVFPVIILLRLSETFRLMTQKTFLQNNQEILFLIFYFVHLWHFFMTISAHIC